MADRILKPDSGNDLILQNDDGSGKIEINENASIPVTGTLDVSGATLTTSSAQKQTIVQAGPGSGTLDVSSGTFTTSSAQKQAIVQAGPGSGTLDVSSGTFTTSTAQKQAIVQAGPGTGTLDVSSGTFTTSTAQKQAIIDGASISSSVPVGSIFQMAFTPDSTWLTTNKFLICDGSSLNSSTDTQYASLYSAIGTTWGGSSASAFNIPDLKGAYLRGVGPSTAFTKNQTITLAQTLSDQMQGHHHQFSITADIAQSGSNRNAPHTPNLNVTNLGMVGNPSSDGSNGAPRTGDETRPNSKGVQFIIKF